MERGRLSVWWCYSGGRPPDGPAEHTRPLAAAGEHVTVLEDPGRFDSLHRVNDLFDDGIATIFGLARGEAELQGFCFQPRKFSPADARQWLREHGFEFFLLEGRSAP